MSNVLLGYQLYVDAAADPLLADGGPQRPYVIIQDAVKRASTIADSVIIMIAPGVYGDPVLIQDFDNFSITLYGTVPRFVFLTGNGTYTPIKIENCQQRVYIKGIDIIDGLAEYSAVGVTYKIKALNPDTDEWELYPPNFDPPLTKTYQWAGGGIYARTNSLLLDDCRFTLNEAYYGSALFLCETKTSIKNCIFEDNIAEGGSSGSGGEGAIICAIKSGVEITKSEFLNIDSNVSSSHAALYINQLNVIHGFNYLIDSCKFHDNRLRKAIIEVAAYPGSNMTVKNNNFAYNHITVT